jgi:hypothetical protein
LTEAKMENYPEFERNRNLMRNKKDEKRKWGEG